MTTVRARARPVCRLSPNEEAHLRHLQVEERRKARLVQVREQEKRLASQLREKVRSKRESERRALKEHVDAALAEAHEAELKELEEKYLSRVGSMGQAHREAQQISEEENRLQELRLLLEAKQRWRAQDRHVAAMKELSANQLKEKQIKQHLLHSKQQALKTEKKRARQVAAADPPSSQMIIMDFEVDRGRRVQFKEAEDYSSSYYHIPNPVVQRMGTPEITQPSAREMAQLQTEETKKMEKSAAALQQEHNEKARLRYKHAIAKVKLEKEKAEMLTQLQSLEREDRASRQKSLAKMPPNMFQPAHRRIEMASEQQREMEGAFERLFVRTQRAPVAHSLAADSSLSPEHSLSTTEQSSMEHSDQPDNRPPLSGFEESREEATTTAPKVTPDSGVHVDATMSTADSGNIDSTLAESTRELDSGVARTTASITSPLQHMTSKPAVPCHSYLHDGMLTSSTSSSDESRDHQHRPQPYRTTTHLSPPRPAWPSSVGIPQDTSSSTDGELISTRAMSTQTPKPNPSQYLVQPGILLDRPELTVTDTTSSDEQSVKSTGRAERRAGTKRPPLPAQTRKSTAGEGMKTLLSMIQTQHQAWNDRLKKRNEFLNTSSTPIVTQPNGERGGSTQPDSLSIYTLSTRESTLSPEPSSEQPQQPSPQSSHSDFSPGQLSISQFHTTLETSTLPPAPAPPPNPSTLPPVTLPHHSSGSGHILELLKSTQHQAQTHPLAQHTQRSQLPSPPSLSLAGHPPPRSDSSPQSELPGVGDSLTQDQQHTHRHTPASYVSVPVQSLSATTVSSVSPLVTSYRPPPVSVPSIAPDRPAHGMQSTVPVTITQPPPLKESSVQLSSTALGPLTSGVRESPTQLESFQTLPEQTESRLPLSVSECSSQPVDSSLTQVGDTIQAATHHVSSVQVYGPLLSTASPTLLVQPSHDFPPLNIDVGSIGTTSPQQRRPVSQTDAVQTSLPEVISNTQENSDQLSILTLDTTQPSFTEQSQSNSTAHYLPTSYKPSQSNIPSERWSPATYQSDHHSTSTSLSYTPPHSLQPASELQSGIKSLSILDTIEESDAENIQEDMTNSDSFRGDRIQDEPPLSVTDLENTDYSLLPPDSSTVPTVTHFSPPPTVSQVDEAVTTEGNVSATNESAMEAKDKEIESPTVTEASSAQSTDTADSPAAPVDSGLSLQEAFLRRKKEFIKKSQQRLEQIKANIEEQKTKQASALGQTPGFKHSTPVTSVRAHSKSSLPSQKRDSGVGTGVEKKHAVRFSNPLLQPQDVSDPLKLASPHTQRGQLSDWLSSRERERINRKEMRERNERFYRRLPEVRKKKEEEKRKQAYSANRDKARHYQETIRSKMKNKKSTKPDTKPQHTKCNF